MVVPLRKRCAACAAVFAPVAHWHPVCRPCWAFHRLAVARERAAAAGREVSR
jgi:hypothetical protein